jgi:adenylylsulfate kinase
MSSQATLRASRENGQIVPAPSISHRPRGRVTGCLLVDESIAALLIVGSVGVGKTSVADRVGRLLSAQGMPGMVIDLDWLCNAWPAPVGDPFREQFMLANLKSVADNARRAGFDRLVLAGVVESTEHRDRVAAAVARPLVVCRLRVRHDIVRRRLAARHVGDPDGLTWHVNRLPELDSVLDDAAVADVEIEASDLTLDETAAAVLDRTSRRRP